MCFISDLSVKMADEAVVVINGERLSRREAFLQLKAGIGKTSGSLKQN